MGETETSVAAHWERFLDTIQPVLSVHVFETWLRPIRCQGLINGVVTLEVRDQFSQDWLSDHYLDFIRDGLSKQIGESVAIEWSINPELKTKEAPEPIPISEKTPTVSDSIESDGGSRKQLNKRYVFGTFVAGPSNEFGYAACQAVAENPGKAYNPLFLFGKTGLGKTHLVSAIGHQILQGQEDLRVIYTSSEQFTNEVVNAVLGAKLAEFQKKYRTQCDVLLIDDIQLIAGKDRTQHEFFHIFNTLHDSQRQIVITSDKLPHEIPDIEERLRSRFQWGLIADIQPPEIETRVAILRKKAQEENINLPDDATFFLAENIRSNVRELEGALVRVMAHASITRSPITVDYVREVLGDILVSRAQRMSVESIQKTVADYFHVRVADLKSRRRHKTMVRPRQVAMYLCRKHSGASYPDLGSRFGDKDHTTIMSACKKIDKMMKADAALRNQLNELERQLDVMSK